MADLLTRSIQDYLKNIYELNETGGPAATTDLAARLRVAPASVTGMVRRLSSSNPPLVVYKKHQGVTLTRAGRRAALEVIRHHRLLEAYLVNLLGYSWDEVHEEACRLEHVISEDFETRISVLLGHPTRDPHGDPIPNEDLTMPADETRPLASLGLDETAMVKRVASEDPALLRYLRDIGVVPEARVTALEFSEFDGNLTLKVEGRRSRIVLGKAVTTQVFVDK
ncbi:MAG: putative DtxR family transcriptional regulator [Candidatus Krumholzibacteriota bacterium]|nr:putative DtxR family transcriptional regulator [Candidatus Krumholzibacteriota bacterium]